jgi:hypothetical protein
MAPTELPFNMEFIQPETGEFQSRRISSLRNPDHKRFFYRTLEWALSHNVEVRIRPINTPKKSAHIVVADDWEETLTR